MKFNRKDFRHKFLGEKSFRDEVMYILKPHLESLLGSKEISAEEKVRYGDFMKSEDERIKKKILKMKLSLLKKQKLLQRKLKR